MKQEIKELECFGFVNKKVEEEIIKSEEYVFDLSNQEELLISEEYIFDSEEYTRHTGQNNINFKKENKKNNFIKCSEVKKMEIKKISWSEALAGQEFLNFDTGIRTKIKIKNWFVSEEEVKKYKSEEYEIGIVFNADVVEQDGKEVDKKIRSQSKRLMIALRPFLEDKNETETVFLSIKKIGEDKSSNYDVELIN